MNASHFELKFTIQGHQYKASCTKFRAWKHPQYYVVVSGDKSNSLIQTFYQTGDTVEDLFWFKQSDNKETIRKALASALKRKFQKT